MAAAVVQANIKRPVPVLGNWGGDAGQKGCVKMLSMSKSLLVWRTGKMSFEEAGVGDQDPGVWKGLSRGRSVR